MSSTPSPAASRFPDAYLLGRWFAAARRQGFLAQLSPDAWHTLSAVLSFTARDGRRAFTVDQLALALGVPRDTAAERLTALAATIWRDQPLLSLETDRDGAVVGATVAPIEILARVTPCEADEPAQPAHPLAPSGDADAALAADLQAAGLDAGQIDRLTHQFPVERIRRQLDWLPQRHARNPAALLLRAIEQDWEAPREAA